MTAGPQGPAGSPGADGAAGVNGLDANVSTMFPIGSIYITTNATNPATLFGFGTWELIAPGRVIVGYNASDGRFNTIGNTGGNYTWQI
jgi:hypothetical protein